MLLNLPNKSIVKCEYEIIMASTLKPYAVNPISSLNLARQVFRSDRIKTIFVEGVNDKRFYSQWNGHNDKIRIQVLYQKDNVVTAHNAYITDGIGLGFARFIVDIDYDILTEKEIYEQAMNYHVYHSSFVGSYFNDLESFLVSTCALQKYLANFDYDLQKAEELRLSILNSAWTIGAFRVADHNVVKRKCLGKSILDGLEICDAFFDDQTANVSKEKLLRLIENRHRNSPHINDLLEEAELLLQKHSSKFVLSRGHDITEMLSQILTKKKGKKILRSDVELGLRLAIEKCEINISPMSKFDALIKESISIG